jgi:hypothetical protein
VSSLAPQRTSKFAKAGASTLCLASGSLPQLSYLPTCPRKAALVDGTAESVWLLYTDTGRPTAMFQEIRADSLGDPLQVLPQQPSNPILVYNRFCGLSEIIRGTLYILYSPTKLLTANVILSTYTRYLA